MIAISINTNYGIHPLILCVVESENMNSWVYFIERLYEQIGCNGGNVLCFMSDKYKVVLKALTLYFLFAWKDIIVDIFMLTSRKIFLVFYWSFHFGKHIKHPIQLNSIIICHTCIASAPRHTISLCKFQLAIGLNTCSLPTQSVPMLLITWLNHSIIGSIASEGCQLLWCLRK